MAHRIESTVTALAFLFIGMSGASAQSLALAAKPAGKPAHATATAGASLRTADGQPDLQGFWTNHHGYSFRTAPKSSPIRRSSLPRKRPTTPSASWRCLKQPVLEPTPTYITIWPNLAWRRSQSKIAANVAHVPHFRSARRPDSRHDARGSQEKRRSRRVGIKAMSSTAPRIVPGGAVLPVAERRAAHAAGGLQQQPRDRSGPRVCGRDAGK